MRAVVMSDTHMPKKAKNLPKVLVDYLQTTDLIIHVGDWQTIDVYHLLKRYAPVKGVVGNVDDHVIGDYFPKKNILKLKGYSIGLVHGHEGKGRTTEECARRTFANDKVDAVIFGHSHIPVYKELDNLLLFNPGSPTDKRRMEHYSFGLLTLEKEMTIEHIYFKD